MIKTLGVLATLSLFLLGAPGGALAISVIELEGDPCDSSSWNQAFTITNATGITSVQVWAEGNFFSSPAFQSYYTGFDYQGAGSGVNSVPVPGWGQYFESADNTIAAGDGTAFTPEFLNGALRKTLRFYLEFGDANQKLNPTAAQIANGKYPAPDFTLHIQAYDASGLRADRDYVFDSAIGGGTHTFGDPLPGSWNQSSPIPEPVTMAGLLLGLGSMGQYLRKRRLT